jgi:hypothetical protein
MKTILFTALCYMALLSCKAQIYPMEDNDVGLRKSGMSFKDINNNLDKFEGTWEYTDANIRFKLVLQKIEDYPSGSATSDMIVGNIIYEENGVEVINTLTNPSTSQGSDDIYHLELLFFKNPSLIRGHFEDPVRSKWTTYTLDLTHSINRSLNNSTAVEQLQWSVQITEFYDPNDDVDAAQALRVPKELVLTKV